MCCSITGVITRVGHCRRLFDQRFYRSQTDCQLEELGRLGDLFCLGEVTGDFKGEHGAEAPLHLILG